MIRGKKLRVTHQRSDFFDALPDDIVISILCKLISSARCPSDFIQILQTCKKLSKLGLNPLVLSKAGSKTFSIRAKNWSEKAEKFLRLCIKAGNVEAYYTLGMIRFYCLQNRGSGASLMAKAAIKSHAPALYSLAVIQFNGSGGSKNDKDLRAGVALCARAAYLGHIDALRELGHCFQDGYGVRQNVAEGRRLLIQANALELASVIRAAMKSPPLKPPTMHGQNTENGLVIDSDSGSGPDSGMSHPLLSDFGCNVPTRETHPANIFLTEWFEPGVKTGSGSDLRLCSHGGCGRPETRRNEFRRCSVCGTVNYCSRGCQALDWKFRHKVKCAPMDHWNEEVDGHDLEDRMGEIEEEADGGALEIE